MRKERDKRKEVEPRRRTRPARAPAKSSRAPRAAENLPHATLDGLAAHVAVVNQKGVIEAVNKAWRDFGADNGPVRGRIAEGADYLAVCDAASGDDRELALAFAGAIREVLAGRRERFEAEYPCHSPDRQRWFIGRVSRLPGDGSPRAVIAHEDITSRKLAEMALERSQAQLRAIYENAPVMMCVMDAQRQSLFANRALREFTGTEQTDLVAERACNILGCASAPAVADASNISPECAACQLRQAVEDTLKTGNGHQDVEYHAALERNGVRRTATLLGSTAMIQSGNQSWLLLCIHDVSEREQAKQERLRIIAELNAAQRIAKIGSWRWDLVTDTAHWSEELYRIFEPATALSSPHRTNFMQLVHPDDRQRVAQARTDAVIENKRYDIEFRIQLPDGRVKVVHSQGEVLRRDDGMPILMHGTTQDITERKAAEEERVGIIADLNEAQRIAQVGSWRWDLATDKAQWSDETYRIFGLAPVSLAHHRHSFLDMVHPDDRGRTDQALLDAVNGRRPYDLEYRIRLPDGRERVIHAHAEVLRREDGTATALHGTVQDITERKQLEDELRHTAASLAEAQRMSQIGSWHSVFKGGEEILSESDEERRIWGFGAGERTTVQAVLDRIHPDDRTLALEHWAAARRDGKLREWEHRLIVDGRVKWIRARIQVDLDASGEPIEGRGTSQDITEQKLLENELRHAAASLAEAQAMSRIGSWRVVLKDGAESWSGSDELRRIWGYPAGYPITMQTGMDRMHPDDIDRTREIWTAAVGGAGPMEWEHRIVVDGQVKWVQARIQVERHASGRPVEIHGTCQDITEQKRAQEVLRASEEQYRNLFEYMFGGFILLEVILDHVGNPVDHRLLQANSEFDRMTGLRRSEEIGRTGAELSFQWPPDVAQSYYQVAQGGEPLHVERFNESLNRHYDARVFSPRRGQFAVLFYDITDRKRLEDELRHTAANLAEAQTMSRIGSWRVVYKDGAQSWNVSDEILRIWGFPPGYSLTREALLSRMHPDDSAATEEVWAKAMQNVGPTEWEHRIIVDGKVKWIHARIQVDLDEAGRLVEIRGTNQDITERKHVEEEASVHQAAIAQLSRVVAMGELTAGIAHEINQPLGASLLYAETCRDLLKGAPPDVAQLLPAMNTLVGQLERAKATVARMRKFIRRKPLSFSTVDANQLLVDTAKLLAYELKEAKVRLVLKLQPLTAPSRADPVLIQQVALNFMINAIEAMRKSNSPRRLTLGTSAAADGSCIVSVADTGPGVPELLADRVFDSFVTSKPEGMGLGLAISRSIVEQHGGRIWYEPGEKGGAVFKFSLPSMPSGAKEDLQ